MNIYTDLSDLLVENLRELIVAPNAHNNSGEDFTRIYQLFSYMRDWKGLSFFGAMYEESKNDNKHYHCLVYWDNQPPLTTVRSWIKKILGVSCQVIDWKYRKVKILKSSVQYVLKDDNMHFNFRFPEKIYNKYKKSWNVENFKKYKSSKKNEIINLIKPCNCCQEWGIKYCRRDIAYAVREWYDVQDKEYNNYLMKKTINSLWFKLEENKESHIDELLS